MASVASARVLGLQKNLTEALVIAVAVLVAKTATVMAEQPDTTEKHLVGIAKGLVRQYPYVDIRVSARLKIYLCISSSGAVCTIPRLW